MRGTSEHTLANLYHSIMRLLLLLSCSTNWGSFGKRFGSSHATRGPAEFFEPRKNEELKDQGCGRGVPPFFTTGSEPKKGIPLSHQGYGRGVPPFSLPDMSPKTVYLSLIKATVGGCSPFSLPDMSQKTVYLSLIKDKVGGYPQCSLPGVHYHVSIVV